MREWVVFALLAFFSWGIFGFFAKLTSNAVSPLSAIVYYIVGVATVAVIFGGYLWLLVPDFRLDTGWWGAIFGIATGITGLLGTVFLLLSLRSGGEAAIVVPMTALYPLLTAVLAFVILHERISFQQGVGMVLALVAIWLMAR
jgi:transporter family protein